MKLRWKILLGALGAAAVVGGAGAFTVFGAFQYRLEPDRALLVTTDVERFMQLRARLPRVSDTAAFLDSAYFSKGTPGLRAYAALYRRDGARLRDILRQRGTYYDSIPDLAARVESQFPAIRAAFAALGTRYSRAVFPPTYFVVGGLGPGGNPGRRGLYIGADRFSAPDSEPRARGIEPLSMLPHLVAHELTHFNQFAAAPVAYATQWSNLARAVKEGSADLVAELVSGRHLNDRAHAYGRAHEAELWRRFSRDMHTSETAEWFWRVPADSSQPPDLGYFIGYAIVRSWYDRNRDDPRVLERLMRVSDYPAFLQESGYSRRP